MRMGFHQSVIGQPEYHPGFMAESVLASGLHGLGLSQTENQIGSVAATGAALTGTILSSSLFGIAAAGPIGAVAAGLIALGFTIANVFRGCGATCTQASAAADQVEGHLKSNVAAYLAAPVHYASFQAAAANNFKIAWTALLQMCSDPSLGDAGRRCISERQRGGTAPWCPKPGNMGCDWFALYLDPILNDPTVVPDPVAGAGVGTGAGTGTATSTSSANSALAPIDFGLIPLFALGALGVYALWS